jgi:hypothetical protein
MVQLNARQSKMKIYKENPTKIKNVILLAYIKANA